MKVKVHNRFLVLTIGNLKEGEWLSLSIGFNWAGFTFKNVRVNAGLTVINYGIGGVAYLRP